MFQESNFKARESLNKQYSQIKGASSINDVSVGFGKGWIIFAVLSAMASAFSFYQDFNKSLGTIVTVLVVVVLAVALESFKHLSIRGMFSSMNFVSKTLMSFVAIGLIMVSFYTHYKSIATFQKNLVNDDLKSEISYQRDLQKVQNSQINTILQTNAEFAKAFNNGSSVDDKLSSSSVLSNNNLIATLQSLSAKNNMTNTNLLLKESRETAKTTASAILVIFIMVEIMALFSILSKIIVVDNVSGNVKEFFNIMDKLEELESNTYKTLGLQQMQQSKEKIKVVQSQQQREHQKEMYLIGKERVLDNELNTKYKTVKKRKVRKAKAKNNKLKVVHLEKYDASEQELLQALWGHGEVKGGTKLIPRRKVLKEVGTLKGKGGVLTNLYNKLVRDGHIEFNVCYMAKSDLALVLKERK
ncbi:MAG TPA: hypothetical protein EYG94_06425 [Campylobacterales bacterium]|nr:hypothetical protein [Campylobacterales bacterium]